MDSEEIGTKKLLEKNGYKVIPWKNKPTEFEKCKLPLIKIKESTYLVKKGDNNG